MKAPLDIYGEEPVLATIRRAFWYIFEPEKNINQSFVAELTPYPIQVNRPLELHGAKWTPLRLMHGKLPILGYRVDVGGVSMAYCTDVSEVPEETLPALEGLDVLVLDGLRDRFHPTHLTITQALEMIDKLKPGRAYLTHIAHDVSHADLEKRMPAEVAPAYDGLVVECG
jgi:phosphoribosyl 1,2-cyclic phosphate phosphodiesterase